MSAVVIEILLIGGAIGGVAGIAYGVYKKLEGRYYGRKAPPDENKPQPKDE